jgi:hypothetical protein
MTSMREGRESSYARSMHRDRASRSVGTKCSLLLGSHVQSLTTGASLDSPCSLGLPRIPRDTSRRFGRSYVRRMSMAIYRWAERMGGRVGPSTTCRHKHLDRSAPAQPSLVSHTSAVASEAASRRISSSSKCAVYCSHDLLKTPML